MNLFHWELKKRDDGKYCIFINYFTHPDPDVFCFDTKADVEEFASKILEGLKNEPD